MTATGEAEGNYLFNLLIGFDGYEGSLSEGRLFEFTSDEIREELGVDCTSALKDFPALIMPEVGDASSEQVSRIGSISKLRKTSKSLEFKFVPNPNLNPIPTSTIETLASKLEINPDSWEHPDALGRYGCRSLRGSTGAP